MDAEARAVWLSSGFKSPLQKGVVYTKLARSQSQPHSARCAKRYTQSPKYSFCIIYQPKRLSSIDCFVVATLKDAFQSKLSRDQADERGRDCSSAQRFDPDLAAQVCLSYVLKGVIWGLKTCNTLYDLRCQHKMIRCHSSVGIMCVAVSRRHAISFLDSRSVQLMSGRICMPECMQSICLSNQDISPP